MNGSVLFEGSPLLSGSLNVNTGGNIEPLEVEINENGTRTITPPSGVDGYAPIIIETDVPTPPPVVETLNVTQNGTYTPPSGVDGYDEIIVNVTSFPYYDFHSTEDGKIVVRRKFYIENNEIKIEILWFFNGFYMASNLVDIPSNLIDYTKRNTDISGKSYSDNTSSTQNGWIAISTAYYNNKFVCYSTSWLADSNKTIWGVVNNDGGTQQTLEWFDPYDV